MYPHCQYVTSGTMNTSELLDTIVLTKVSRGLRNISAAGFPASQRGDLGASVALRPEVASPRQVSVSGEKGVRIPQHHTQELIERHLP